jgi:long-chain acyl-CoA synthetase
MEIITIKEMLERNAEKYHDRVAFQMKEGKSYCQITYGKTLHLVGRIQTVLIKTGIKSGDRVALISENRPEWALSYLAIVGLGAIAVPLDAFLNPEEVQPLLKDSDTKAIILSKKYIDYIKKTKLEERSLFMEEFENFPTPASTLTGEVKLMSNVVSVASLFDTVPKENLLSILPLHHTFETTVGFLAPFYKGSIITFAESLKSNKILANMQETGVTAMCGVPLLYQLLYNSIVREVEEKNLSKLNLSKLFSILFLISKFFRNVIDVNLGKFLFASVHKKFGGKIRFFVSGGAALDPDIARNFEIMGFTMLQGYGLTESSPVLACCTLEKNKIGSVGQPIPGIEIRISGTGKVGEILAAGHSIMKGYYNQKEFTSRVLIDNWLHTGDLGYLDENGYLFITGRSKDIIVTASGVNVYPEVIEFSLNKIPVVKESCVIGVKVKDGLRKGAEEVVALIVPDIEYLEKLGNEDDESIKEMIAQEVQNYNRRIADSKRIARFIIRKEELPKTRLKKLKRFELKKGFSQI